MSIQVGERNVFMNDKEYWYVRQKKENGKIKVKSSVIDWLNYQNKNEEREKYTSYMISKKVAETLSSPEDL